MKKIIFSFLSIILCLYGFAIEPPTLQCIEQLVGNGRLRITWSWNNLNNVASDDVYIFFVNGVQNSSFPPLKSATITRAISKRRTLPPARVAFPTH